MDKIKGALGAVDGYKIYILCGVGAVVILVNHFIGQIPGTPVEMGGDSDWLTDLWTMLLIASGRSTLDKVGK